MQKTLTALLFVVPFCLFAQPSKSGTDNQVRFICNILEPSSEADSLHVYEVKGFGAKSIAAVLRSPSGTYNFVLPKGKPQIYTVGFNDVAVSRVVLGEESEVKLWANAAYIDRARTLGSVANADLERVNKRTAAYQMGNWNDPESIKGRMAYVDSLKNAKSILWRSANLLIPPFFQGKDPNREVEYYGLNWFNHFDFANDRNYDNVPDVMYAFAAYSSTLASMTTEPMIIEWAAVQLKRIPENSGAYRLALGGLLKGCQQRQLTSVFMAYAKQYVEKYKSSSFGEIPALEYEISKAGTSTPGALAPDLAGMTPDSSNYALSKLLGSIVLVDFWASWCGPCRRENPNVRALYSKYKDLGFEILGVSLDRDANAWKKAINDDQLFWHHISDLKGWQSEHAAIYSVTSIPQTLLIDRQGKLIARNLRGEGLGAKLAEIFGK